MYTGTTSTPPRLIPSTRFTLALLVSFALFVQYVQRVSLSMGIVCMVNRTKINTVSNLNSSFTQIDNRTSAISLKYGSRFLQEKQFFFTELQQQILLGAQWFGYLITLAPGGWLSIKLGAKRTCALGLLLSSTATLAMGFIYFLHNFYFPIAVILRIIVGLGHGPLFPATYTVWSMWAVPLERSTLTSIGFCSPNLGTSVTMLIGGILCRYASSGWVYIFVLAGLSGFIWLTLWLRLMADSPQTHQTISEKERNYICQSIGIDQSDQKKKSVAVPSVPWNKVVRSKPVIALFITQFCNIFGLFFFLSNVGKLLTEIHGVSPQYAGYILGGGFIVMPIVSLSIGITADRLVRAKKMTLTNVRKLFNSLASFIPVGCMIVLCFCDHTRQILGSITVLIFLASSAISYGSGFVVNFADIAPAYSSIIFGVSSSIATFGTLVSNIIAGVVIKQPILEDWRKLFILFSIVYFIGGLVYLLYGSAVPRKWATFISQKPEEKANDDQGEVTTMLQRHTDVPSTTKNIHTNQTIQLPE